MRSTLGSTSPPPAAPGDGKLIAAEPEVAGAPPGAASHRGVMIGPAQVLMETLGNVHWYLLGNRRLWAWLLQGIAPVNRGTGFVLEAGCSVGHNAPFLARGGRYVGLDMSLLALRLARSRGILRLVRADAQYLPFRDGAFSWATAFDVLEHVPDDRRACRELSRVCASNGLGIVTAPLHPLLWGSHDLRYGHFRRYRPSRLRAHFHRDGWRLVRYHVLHPLLFFPFLVRRILDRRRGLDPSRDDFVAVAPWLNAVLERLLWLEGALFAWWRGGLGTSLLLVGRPARSP